MYANLMFANLLLLVVNGVAWAQEAAAPAAAPAKPSMLETFMPFIFVLVIFYFLLIRPQSKRAQRQAAYLSGLKRGDCVLTSGGVLGTIEGLTDRFVTLQIDDGVKMRVLRSQIAGPAEEEKKS